jgi:hypothetical protein
MKIEQLERRKIKDKVSIWTSSVLEEALCQKDILLMVQSYVLLELCDSLFQKGEIPFEEILKAKTSENFIKSSPSLFIEFLLLMKKYRPDLYTIELVSLVDVYQLILKEIWDDSPNNIDVFLMLNMISRLKSSLPEITEPSDIKISEDSFLLKSKTVIKRNLNYLLIASNYGQKNIELTAATIEAIETIMLDAAAKYDLILASKAFKILICTRVKNSYNMELVYDFFLKNQSIEGYIGHYEGAFSQTNTKDIAKSQQVQITKEIILAILEYNSSYRYIRDFSSYNVVL